MKSLKKLVVGTALAISGLAFVAAPNVAQADHVHQRSRSDFRRALDNIYRADTYIVNGRYRSAEDEIYSAIDHLRDDGSSDARRAIRYLNQCLDQIGHNDSRARDYLNSAESIPQPPCCSATAAGWKAGTRRRHRTADSS